MLRQYIPEYPCYIVWYPYNIPITYPMYFHPLFIDAIFRFCWWSPPVSVVVLPPSDLHYVTQFPSLVYPDPHFFIHYIHSPKWIPMIPSLNPHVSPPFLLLKSLLGIHPTILPAESQWPQWPQWSGIPHPPLASFSFLFPSNDHRIISNRHTSQGLSLFTPRAIVAMENPPFKVLWFCPAVSNWKGVSMAAMFECRRVWINISAIYHTY